MCHRCKGKTALFGKREKGAPYMSAEDNKAIVRRAYDAINRNDLDALDEMVDSDITDHDPAPGQGPGLEGVKQYFSSLHTAFPDVQMSVDYMVAEGDKVVARVSVSGTHQGEFLGIDPTGNQVAITGLDVLRIVDGKIVEHWGNFDDLGMLQQLGVIEQPSE
jgi:steroid delta-isomerase-like uncharacterized protein